MSKFCPNCGAQLNDDANFCEVCGEKIENTSTQKKCASCGTVLLPESKFCPTCGLPANGNAPQAAQPVQMQNVQPLVTQVQPVQQVQPMQQMQPVQQAQPTQQAQRPGTGSTQKRKNSGSGCTSCGCGCLIFIAVIIGIIIIGTIAFVFTAKDHPEWFEISKDSPIVQEVIKKVEESDMSEEDKEAFNKFIDELDIPEGSNISDIAKSLTENIDLGSESAKSDVSGNTSADGKSTRLPMPSDFSFYYDDQAISGVPADAVTITDPAKYNGSWMATFYGESNGDWIKVYFTVDIDLNNSKGILKWSYVEDSLGEAEDVSILEGLDFSCNANASGQLSMTSAEGMDINMTRLYTWNGGEYGIGSGEIDGEEGVVVFKR